MGIFKDDPPQPPDPIATAGAQTSTNVSTAVANAFLNNMNQVTPEGSLLYDKTSEYNWIDPTTGQNYVIPRFTVSQTLSPQQEQLRQLNLQSDTNLATLAANQSSMLTNLLGTPFDPRTGAPAAGNIGLLGGPDASSGFDRSMGIADTLIPEWAGSQSSEFGPAGDITRSYGPVDNFSADRSRVEEAMFQRLSPQLELDRQRLEQRLADQGIRYGDKAYENAMADFNRQLTDTRLGITARGGEEQQRLMDIAAKRAGFENAAQMQAYQQAAGRGAFANEAQAQAFNQLVQKRQFYNQGQQQRFAQEQARANFYNNAVIQNLARNQQIYNAQNAARAQAMTEATAVRQAPINEITALLSGGQVQQPSWINTAQNQIATTDIAGLINQRFQQDLANVQLQNKNVNDVLGGFLGAAGNIGKGYFISDRTEKDDVERMGSVYAAGPDGEKPLPIYEYSYKDDPASMRHVGPMAQDVEKIDRSAVKKFGGKRYIDKTKLSSILKVA